MRIDSPAGAMFMLVDWLRDALTGFWAFVTSPADSVPAALALAALALGIVNLVRSVRATPRPRLLTSSTIDDEVHTNVDSFGDPEDWQPLVLSVINRGDGIAYDVRVRLRSADDQGERELGALKLDETGKASFNAAAKSFPWPGAFELTWWEYPSEKRTSLQIEYGPGHTESRYGP